MKKQLKDYYAQVCEAASQEIVAIEHHVKNMMELLVNKNVIGVCGIAGIGKTTLLQSLDKEIRHEGKHLVAHLEVRNHCVEEVQQSILFQLNSTRKPSIPIVMRPPTPEIGRTQLAQCLRYLKERGRKNICLIIDGVLTKTFWEDLLPDDLDELLSPSSCLIASSRDVALAHGLFQYCCKDLNETSLYLLPPLSTIDANALFCAKAEMGGILLEETEQQTIMRDIVPLCGGLPLALVKCGIHFSSKEARLSKQTVEKQLREALKGIPCKDIFEVLEDSIDQDNLEAFVDLALFWKEKELKKAKLAMLKEDGTDTLGHFQQKCLVLGDKKIELVKVPILMEALAKRLSHEHNVRYAHNSLPLAHERGQVRGFSCIKRIINIDDLTLMQELRFLDIKQCQLQLNLLQTIIPFWANLPIQRYLVLPLAFSFLVPNIILVIYSPIVVSLLILSISLLIFFLVNQMYAPVSRPLSHNLTFVTLSDCANVKKLTKNIGKLMRLRYLNLSFNSSFKRLPPSLFISLTSLIHLDLSNCENLEQIPTTIGHLESLKTLELRTCTNLQELPDSISNLTSLKTLILSNCYRLRALPNSIDGLKSLRLFKLSNCSNLKQLPVNIFNLTTLQDLDVSQNTKLEGWWPSIANFISLEYLNMSQYDKLENLPAAIGNLKSLKVLNLVGCKRLKRLPETISKLTSLEALYISSCDELEDLPMESIEKLPHLEKISIPMKYRDMLSPDLKTKIIYEQTSLSNM